MIDLACSIALFGALSLAVGRYAIASVAAGRLLVTERVEREAALPIVGRAPMHAVYRTLTPIARLFVSLRISANVVSVGSFFLALAAAVAFALGHFGAGALVAATACLMDAIDGLIARLSNTASRFGKVLDTTIDRYVDAMLLGGIGIYVRLDLVCLVLVMAAIVGSFMVSYASAVERELGLVSRSAPMRRAHRLAYLLFAAAVEPFASRLGFALVPVLFSVGAIAIVGNASAVRRLFQAALVPETKIYQPDLEVDMAPHHDHAK